MLNTHQNFFFKPGTLKFKNTLMARFIASVSSTCSVTLEMREFTLSYFFCSLILQSMTVYNVGNFQFMFELALLPRRMDLRQPLESGPIIAVPLKSHFSLCFHKGSSDVLQNLYPNIVLLLKVFLKFFLGEKFVILDLPLMFETGIALYLMKEVVVVYW